MRLPMCSMNIPYMYFEMGSFTWVASTVTTIGEGCGSSCEREQEERTSKVEIKVEMNLKLLGFVEMLRDVEFMFGVKISRECTTHISVGSCADNARTSHPNAAQNCGAPSVPSNAIVCAGLLPS